MIFVSGCADNQASSTQEDNASESEVQSASNLEKEDLSLNSSYFEDANYKGVTFVNSVTTSDADTSVETKANFMLSTAEQLKKYPFPDVSNDYCGNALSVNGTVELSRFNDHPLPIYIVNLEIQPNGNVPVDIGAIQVDFENGNGTMTSLISETSTTIQENGETEEIPKITLQPGRNIGFSITSVNALNILLANSSNGNTSLTIGVYNDGKLIGAFHARLPTVYETNGHPAEIAVGEKQNILFSDYATVRKEVVLQNTTSNMEEQPIEEGPIEEQSINQTQNGYEFTTNYLGDDEHGDQIILHNNMSAVDVTHDQLWAFLEAENENKALATTKSFTKVDRTAKIFNDAELAGINSNFVIISFKDGSILICNAFNVEDYTYYIGYAYGDYAVYSDVKIGSIIGASDRYGGIGYEVSSSRITNIEFYN